MVENSTAVHRNTVDNTEEGMITIDEAAAEDKVIQKKTVRKRRTFQTIQPDLQPLHKIAKISDLLLPELIIDVQYFHNHWIE